MTDRLAALRSAIADVDAALVEEFAGTNDLVWFAWDAVKEAALAATPAPLDVERLAAAINDAQIRTDELRWGRDLTPVAARILAALSPAAPETGPAQGHLAHQPGDFHRYRTVCEVCGEPGQLRVTLEPERAP
jgi:hypothetical protein